MTDLNSLIPGNSGSELVIALGINALTEGREDRQYFRLRRRLGARGRSRFRLRPRGRADRRGRIIQR